LRKTLLPLAIFAAVVLALGVAYYLRKRAIRRELDILYATLRAEGRPVTPEDITGPPVPDDENAATLYDRAFARLPALNEQEHLLFFRLFDQPQGPDNPPPQPEDWDTARTILARCDQGLSLIEQGLARPQYRFNADWSNWGALFTAFHMIEHPHAARMLLRRSQLRLHDGDLPRSIHDLHTALQFCASLQAQPTLLPYMTRARIERLALWHLADIVSEHRLDGRTLDLLDQDIERLSAGASLSDALAGQRVFLCHLFRYVREGKSPVDVLYPYTFFTGSIQRTFERVDAKRLVMRLDSEELAYVRIATRLEDLAKKPLYERTDDIARFKADI